MRPTTRLEEALRNAHEAEMRADLLYGLGAIDKALLDEYLENTRQLREYLRGEIRKVYS